MEAGGALDRNATLRQAYGREQVLDVLEGTPLESHARDNQFGMYLVCRAVGSTDLERWERKHKTMFRDIPHVELPSSTFKIVGRLVLHGCPDISVSKTMFRNGLYAELLSFAI